MPPEVTLGLLAILGAVSAGIAKLITAIVDRRVKQMNEDAEAVRLKRESDLEEARKDREQKRNREMEEMRQETAKAQADAEQAKAIGENLTTLNTTIIKLIDSHVKERHADRMEMSNQAQSIGDMSESLEKMAVMVNDNNARTKALETVVGRIYDRFSLLFPTDKPAVEQVRDGLIEVVNKVYEQKKSDSQEIEVVAPVPPPELPKAAGE